MPERLEVSKTYKLFIGGAFPRSESGRSLPITGKGGVVLAHTSHASRKDLRDAVESARAAQPRWGAASAYNRGQVLYRMAEMMEGKRDELEEALAVAPGPSARRAAKAKRSEVSIAIDRIVHYAGWADKFAQVLGCHNPVAGPYYNFTIPEPTGVVAVITPDHAPLLALVSLLVPVLCAGNTVVALASQTNPLPAIILCEVCATSDVPAGVVNVLTGVRAELIPHIATHRDIDGVHAANLSAEESAALRAGVAENLKRVTVRGAGPAPSKGRAPAHAPLDWADDSKCNSPAWIEPFVEFKTIWHPALA